MTETQQNDSTQAVLRFRNAYQRLIEEIRAVPETEMLQVNLDVVAAVTTTLGAGAEIRGVRSAIVKQLPEFDIQSFDKLEDLALALGHAHTVYSAASQPEEAIDELVKEGLRQRELLLLAANAVAARNLIDGQRLKDLIGGSGHRNLAADLFKLVELFRINWEKLLGKVPVQLAELEEVEILADRIITAVGVREQGQAATAAATADRQRAFTLFITTYDQVRRAVSYLRWDHNDADDITPSLYTNRGKRKAGADLPEKKPSDAVPAAVPAATPPATAAPVATSNTIPVGLPGASPFRS